MLQDSLLLEQKPTKLPSISIFCLVNPFDLTRNYTAVSLQNVQFSFYWRINILVTKQLFKIIMALMGLLNNGSMFDWTHDENMYSRFLQWKQRVKMVFESALRTVGEPAQCEYLKYWMGKEGCLSLNVGRKVGNLLLKVMIHQALNSTHIRICWK